MNNNVMLNVINVVEIDLEEIEDKLEELVCISKDTF
jgi:hypothetical protein